MKRVTRNNLLKLIDMMKDHEEQEEKDKQLLQRINDFIDNVINKDKRYYSKLSKYNFTNEQLKYLLQKGGLSMKRIYDLISGLYEEEVNDYNKYMRDNPNDKQRTREHILTSAIYGKILHSIKDMKENKACCL